MTKLHHISHNKQIPNLLATAKFDLEHTIKKPLITLALVFAICAHAQDQDQDQESAHHRQHISASVIALAIASVDKSSAAYLQAQGQDQTVNNATHDNLKQARGTLKADVDAALANGTHFEETIRRRMKQKNEARHLAATALRIDENFDLLIAAATEEQATQLISNHLALNATRQSIRDARETGSNPSAIHVSKKSMHDIFNSQQALASEVIAANAELNTHLLKSSESLGRSTRQLWIRQNKH